MLFRSDPAMQGSFDFASVIRKRIALAPLRMTDRVVESLLT